MATKVISALVYLVVCTSGASIRHTNRSLRAKRTAENCALPSNITALFTSLNSHINTSLFLKFNQIEETPRYLPNELNTDKVFDSTYLYDSACPSAPLYDIDLPIYARSICPWYYDVENLASGYFPSVPPQAKCKCDTCVQNNIMECDRVTTKVRVLKDTGCVDGFRSFQPELKTLYVACVCVTRRGVESPDTPVEPTSSTTTTTTNPCGAWGCNS